MSVKMSQAFAAYRAVVISEVQQKIALDLSYKFNAEIEDIRKGTEEQLSYVASLRAEGKEAAAASIENLAEKSQRARLLDLQMRRSQVLDELNKDMLHKLDQRLSEYGAEVGLVNEPVSPNSEKTHSVKKAQFPDGSQAKVPMQLWVDYSQFQSL